MVIFIEGKKFSLHLCIQAGTGVPIQWETAISFPKTKTAWHKAKQPPTFSTDVIRKS
jgi:hypothetical protein